MSKVVGGSQLRNLYFLDNFLRVPQCCPCQAADPRAGAGGQWSKSDWDQHGFVGLLVSLIAFLELNGQWNNTLDF